MSNAWDIERLRKIAGTTITESVDDDEDDMTPAEKALADKAEKDLKKGGVKVKHIDPEKDIAKLAKNSKSEATEKKEINAENKEAIAAEVGAKKEKAEAPNANPKTAKKLERKAAAAGAESKKGEEPEAKKNNRGRTPSDTSKTGLGRAYLKSNPGATRGEFIKHMGASHQMTNHHANQQFYAIKKKLNEFYIITHPYLSGFVLAENREMSQYQWVDAFSPLEPLIFEKESEAKKVAQYMAEWKNQQTVIEHCLFEGDDKSLIEVPVDKEEKSHGPVDKDHGPVDKDALKKVSQAREWLKAHPLTSREKFAAHTKEAHDWAPLTSNSFYDAFEKADKKEKEVKKD